MIIILLLSFMIPKLELICNIDIKSDDILKKFSFSPFFWPTDIKEERSGRGTLSNKEATLK